MVSYALQTLEATVAEVILGHCSAILCALFAEAGSKLHLPRADRCAPALLVCDPLATWTMLTKPSTGTRAPKVTRMK